MKNIIIRGISCVIASLWIYFPVAANIELVNVDTTSNMANGWSQAKTATPDGRYVLFDSDATNLVANDINATTDIFVRDVYSDTTTRVSTDSSGNESNWQSLGIDITPDGRFVLFQSDATNLVANDTNSQADIFIKDIVSWVTVRVNTDSAGIESSWQLAALDITPDGRFVLFQSDASDLVANDTNATRDIFVKDLNNGSITRVSTDSSGNESNWQSFAISITPDGRYILLGSDATNLVANDTNAAADIFVKDLLSGIIIRASVSSPGGQWDGPSYARDITPDGRYILFQSDATNLVANDTNATTDIFVKDLNNGSTTRISVSNAGIEWDGTSYGTKITSDGRYVLFESDATNLVANDTNATTDIFVRDTTNSTTTRISVNNAGIEWNGFSEGIDITPNGRFVLFDSSATNLVANDTNGRQDVFIRDITDGTTKRINISNAGIEGDFRSDGIKISDNGSFSLFVSDATNLVLNDINAVTDIFMYTTPNADCSIVTDVSQSECYALTELYKTTNWSGRLNQANRMRSGDATPSTVCDWFGVWCFGSWVRDISLQSNLLSGTLPASLSWLIHLENFTVSANYLYGSLSSAWSTRSKIQYFDIYNNNITGPLPSSRSTRTGMQYFYGYSNQINSSLPSSWSTWESVRVFNVANNSITGSLPSSWSTWKETQQFLVNNNDINWTLPDSWSTWAWLDRLNAEDNNLTGSLPASWGALSWVQSLWFTNNTLQGTLPASWSGMTSAATIRFSGNNLQWDVPSSWIYLTNLSDYIMPSPGLTLDNNCLNTMLPEPPQSFVDQKAWVTRKTNQDACGPAISGMFLPAPTITSPTSWQSLSSSSVTIMGTGHPGATIHITIGSTFTTIADINWQRSYSLVWLADGAWQTDVYQTATWYPASSTTSVYFSVNTNTPPVYTPPQQVGFGGWGGGGWMAMAMALSALMQNGSQAASGQTIILTPTKVTPSTNWIVTNKWNVRVGESGYKTYTSVDGALTPLDIATLIQELRNGSASTMLGAAWDEPIEEQLYQEDFTQGYIQRVDTRKLYAPLVMSALQQK
jgi:hypothetical protein